MVRLKEETEMDINEAKNILGQINLVANEGAKDQRDPKGACELIVRLSDDLAKTLYVPLATVEEVESVQPQAAPVTESQQ